MEPFLHIGGARLRFVAYPDGRIEGQCDDAAVLANLAGILGAAVREADSLPASEHALRRGGDA